MSHEHPLKTVIPDFRIDPKTREITQTAPEYITVMQFDHNSENLLFECPRLVDGHDMSLCDKVEVHFVNAAANGSENGIGKYRVKDIAVSQSDPDLVHFTWVVDRNATKHVGTLVFAVQFTCLDGTKIDYAWHTSPFSYISIDQGLVNELDESYTSIYLDNLETEAEGRIDQITTATLDRAIKALENSIVNDVQTLGARMDTFTKLAEGSTTGDAELMDVRVGANGVTYDSAGTAVREQFTTLNDGLHNTPFFARYEKQSGYLNIHTGAITNYTDCLGIITDFIPCKSGVVYLYQGTASASVASVCWYDAKKEFISAEQYESENVQIEIVVPVGAVFARFCSFKYTKNGTPILKLTRSSKNTFGSDARLETVEETLGLLQGKTDNLANGNVLHGKKWVACGDSYTSGDFSDFVDDEGLSGTDSPVIYDSEMGMYKTYPWWIATRNSMDLVLDAVGGSTMALSNEYVRGDDVEQDYRSPFSLNRYKNIPADADYITLMFGLNEEKSNIGTLGDKNNNTVIGAWNVVLKHILTTVPYAKVGIIISDGWTSQKMHDALVSVAEYWGIPYLDMKGNPNVPMMLGGRLSNINVNPVAVELRNSAFYVSDSNQHPNIKAHEYRSVIIENWLRSL